MYVRNNEEFDINVPHTIDGYQYGPSAFTDPDVLSSLGIEAVHFVSQPAVPDGYKLILVGFDKDSESRWVAKWNLVPKTAEELAAEALVLAVAKEDTKIKINGWRETANHTVFSHGGKQIACDPLSRGDIDAVAIHIALTGIFPAGFPGAWKSVDNSYIPLPSVEAFKSMYSSMTSQGTANFSKSQSLKAALNSATKLSEVEAITWD